MLKKLPIPFRLEAEFRMSFGWAVTIVLLFGLIFISISNPDAVLSERMKTLLLTALFYALALLAWLVHEWLPLLSRWIIVVGFTILVQFGVFWLGELTFLSLLVLPVLLAAALLGFMAAVMTTLYETVLLIALANFLFPDVTVLSRGISVAALWFTLALLVALYLPLRRVTQWSFENYQQAQDLLEEARDRKAEFQHVQTELVRTNWKLSLLNEKLHHLTMAADEARKAKEIFVAKVSHEFRTPLNMIIALADLLVETPEIYGEKLPEPLLEDLTIVQRNCKYLAGLIDDVLDLSQSEAGHLHLQPEWVDLREDVDMVVDVVQPILQKKKLAFKVICPEDLTHIYCDRIRVRQVMLNLVSNAARFTQRGGITLTIQQRESEVTIRVADTGPGLAKADLGKVFEPFFQATGNAWQDQGGNGLGLSISKQFVELHQGRMWLESELGVGSTFSFSLPVTPTPPNPTLVPPVIEEWRWREPDLEVRLPQLPFKERLIVWDESGTFAQAGQTLRDTEIIRVRTLQETLQMLEQCPAHAVIVNTADPAQDLERLSSGVKDTPTFACSFPSEPRLFLEAGAANYLTKPVTLEKLSEALTSLQTPLQRILIVDDNPDIHQVLTRLLSLYKPGLEVTAASSGREALEQLRQSSFDLILLDLTLPDKSGWEILREKNQQESCKDIPTIIVSAQDFSQHPVTTKTLWTTTPSGFSSESVLRCSLEFSRLLRPRTRDALEGR